MATQLVKEWTAIQQFPAATRGRLLELLEKLKQEVIYELKAGGVDERRLVGAKLEKLAEGESAIRGGSVKQISFYYWQLWRNRSAAAEAPPAVNNVASAFSSPAPSTKGRHFLVICCENKTWTGKTSRC
ncbi:unnamed protein product [Fraxinus pennsylvanica]|uniref:Uncharacterized protein n=1 Tax=Fraxinus pennsylvanica TaxID=56036 RepID=A0AAD1ZHW6_9LAMI|nr:unnamed protein product [Fraxinus pennsylvanica]